MKEYMKHTVGSMARYAFAIALSVVCVNCVMAQDRRNNNSNNDDDVLEGRHTSRYYASRAENYEESNAWEAAKREIDEGLELYPDDPDLRYLNGRYYYYAQGDLTQARYNLVKAIQINDQHYRAKRILLDVEDSAKHYSSAICYANELLEFQPYDRDLWRRKIALYNKIGHHVEAEAALDQLARIYPHDSIAIRDTKHGTVIADVDSAAEGETVSLTVIPETRPE